MYPNDDSLLFVDEQNGIQVVGEQPLTYYSANKLKTHRDNDFDSIVIRICDSVIKVAKEYPNKYDYKTIYFSFFKYGKRDQIVWILKGPIAKFKKVSDDLLASITLTPLFRDKAVRVLKHFKQKNLENVE